MITRINVMPNEKKEIFVESQLKKFFTSHKLLKYKKNQIILQSEDLPQGVYYLKKGFVRVYNVSHDGHELTFNIFTKGSFFPIFWAINDTQNDYYFETMSEVEVFRAPKEEFLNFIHSNAQVMSQVNELVLHSLTSTLIRLQYLVMGKACERVACVLVMLVRRFGKITKKGFLSISFPVTQQQIAQLAALTRESVGVELSKLKGENVLCMRNRCYVINNYDKLVEKSSYYPEGKTMPYTY
jgi:CRP/FNR family transcriptional regulator, cyclic AMP receptor protein